MIEANSSPLLQIAFAAFFILAIIFSFLINGLLLKFSRTLGNRNIQNWHTIRWSNNVKPSVGGFSFYIVFLISISIYGIFNFSEVEYMNKQLLGIVAAVTSGFLLGLADDAYDTIPVLKFFTQLCCGLFLVFTGTLIPATGTYSIDVLFTVIWVIGIMNSINMLDNMDGITGIVSLFIMLACLLVMAVDNHLYSFYSLMLLGVSGAVAGFMYFNWHPARIYMGDTGSQFLGAFIAAISIPVLWKFHSPSGGTIQLIQFLIPLMAFTVPIIDTITVVMRRIARGQSPFIGGRDHITHHFAYAGLNDKQVIYLLGGVSFLAAVFTAFLVAERSRLNTVTIAGSYIGFVLLFVIVQYVYNIGMKKEKARIKSGESGKQELKSTTKPTSATA